MRKIICCLLFFTMILCSCSVNDSNYSTSSSGIEKSTQEIVEKVKDYIINGQKDKPEALKLKWSKTFLDKVDISSLYERYVDNGGDSKDIEKFAEYITLNAPKPDDWQDLFKEDLKNIYGEEVEKIEHLDGDLYQAYVNKDGREVPYVVVSSRTGYFHG